MSPFQRSTNCRAWLVACCMALVAGCAQFQLPAIDPTGQHIFAPGRYTTFQAPALCPGLPEPAFTAPPVPPPCDPATLGPPVTPPPACGQPLPLPPPPACGQPLPPPIPPPAPPPATARSTGQGRLTLAPARVMAPIGSEVVIVSSYTDTHGALVPKQPIEWMLAPDSVGQILATNDDEVCFRFIGQRESEKRSGTYAVTRTVSRPRLLTRGTPLPNDDLGLMAGQSWVSVTSATEGASHLTALAPEAENWDQRRQAATIYWVDVQWTLPAQAIVQAGQPHTLTTTVRRSSGKPLAGWTVRYQITSGSGIAFAPRQQTAVDIPTDANGAAAVNLIPVTKSNAAQIAIQIIRPSLPGDDLPPMVVGQGWTVVSWSAPDPKVTLYGPETAGVGSTLTYRADVSNAGDVTARQIVASSRLPANMVFLQSNPPAKVIGNVLTWDLGDVAPRSVRPIQITCRPERNGNVRFCVRVEGADQLQGKPLTAEACVDTRVFSSGLALKLSGPPAATVGERVTFEIALTNTGADQLNNVVIRDRLPAGLEHPTERGSVIERALGEPLAPGATRKIAVELIVRQAGRLCHTVDAIAEGGHTATASACVDAQPAIPVPVAGAQAVLTVTLAGPDRGRVGEFLTYAIEVTNTCNLPLTSVRIVGTYERSLYPKEASRGFDVPALARGEVVWLVGRLLPGERVTREIKLECVQPAEAAWCRVAVDAAENVRAAPQERRLQILPGGIVAPPSPPAKKTTPPPGPPIEPAPQNITGDLQISISDTRDPVRINDVVTYVVEIQNGRNVSDKNVTLTITVPAGMEFVKLNGPVSARGQSPDGRAIEVTPIAEMRAGEVLKPFFVEVRGLRIGKFLLKVKVDSLRSPQGVEAEEDTTVNISG